MKSHGMPRLAALTLAAALAWTPAAGGDQQPAGVLELFTSQGCNSCPPADALLAELATEGDVVALAYHVDYWDYLGWRDTLATRENTRHQRDYAKRFGTSSVFTPQAVINGRTQVNGAKREAVFGAIEKDGGLPVDVAIRRSGDRIVIETGAAAGLAGSANLVIVYFQPPMQVTATRGENSGRTIAYWNAVTERQVAGVWDGTAARFEFPAKEIAKKATGGYAVLLQQTTPEGLPGPIIGAAISSRPAS